MAITWFFFVVCCLFSQVPASKGQEQPGCPDQCSCPSDTLNAVYCKLTRPDLPDISQVPTVSILELSCLNSQASIKPKAQHFSSFAEKQLSELKVFGCFKEDLAVDIFWGLIWLDSLEIKQNQIKTLAPDMFNDLANLKYLDLSQNEISKIEPRTFAGLGRLQYLHLENNRLKRVNVNAFEGLTKEVFVYVSLRGNPLICDCHFEPVFKWLKEIIRSATDTYDNWNWNKNNVCAEGNKLKNRTWDSLTSEEINKTCPLEIEETETVESTTEEDEKKSYLSFLFYAVGSVVAIGLLALLVFRLFNQEERSKKGYQPLTSKLETGTTTTSPTKSTTSEDKSDEESSSSSSEEENSKSKSKLKSSNIPKQKKSTSNSVSSSSSMGPKKTSKKVPKMSSALFSSVSLPEKSKKSSNISTK